jgi:hypothetical protein
MRPETIALHAGYDLGAATKITGTVASTELVDLIEVRDRHIASYLEFFVPC